MGNILFIFFLVYSIIITVFAVVMVILYAIQHRQRRLEQQDLEKKRLEIMFSQIKPHFIYNVLNSIYYLCEQDTGKAQEAIEDFSDYLRTNLESVEGDACVPFAREREHIENYLSLEKLRFGDELQIVYDIQTEDFELPALSLQPLVENAVKHGVGESENGGTVKISTEDAGQEIRISIEDSGAGYDPHYKAYEKKERSHVGLSNVRKRLSMMCDGTVDIYTTEGKGTKVIVRIPKKGNV